MNRTALDQDLPYDSGHSRRVALESILDTCTPSLLCEMLSVIADEKAEHLRSNWQDDAAGQLWERVARHFDSAGNRMVKLGMCVALTALLSVSSVHAADKPPAKPRVQPLRTVSVRLMPAGSVDGPWKITTNTERSCSVQVDEPTRMPEAFAACLSAKPERAGCQTVRFNAGKDRLRVVILPNGSWDRTGCDQGKVGGGAK